MFCIGVLATVATIVGVVFQLADRNRGESITYHNHSFIIGIIMAPVEETVTRTYHPHDAAFNAALSLYAIADFEAAWQQMEMSLQTIQERGRAYASVGLQEARRAAFYEHLLDIHIMLTRIALRLNNPQQARVHAFTAFSVLEEGGIAVSPWVRANLHHGLGVAHFNLRQYPLALAEAHHAVAVLEGSGLSPFDSRDSVMATALTLLGNSYQMQLFTGAAGMDPYEMFNRARIHYEMALLNFVPARNRPALALEINQDIFMARLSPATEGVIYVAPSVLLSPSALYDDLTGSEAAIISTAYANLSQLYALFSGKMTPPEHEAVFFKAMSAITLAEFALYLKADIPTAMRGNLLGAYGNYFIAVTAALAATSHHLADHTDIILSAVEENALKHIHDAIHLAGALNMRSSTSFSRVLFQAGQVLSLTQNPEAGLMLLLEAYVIMENASQAADVELHVLRNAYYSLHGETGVSFEMWLEREP